MKSYDAVVIGSGPNGLAAAIRMAERGARVLVLEGMPTLGGGMRTAELTLPGFHHDVCAAAHPMGVLSPYLRTLPLERHGLVWDAGEASVAHPFADGPAVLLRRSLDATMEELGGDAATYSKLVRPFLKDPEGFLGDALAPLRLPKHPLTMLRFGLLGLRSAVGLGRRFEGERAKALLAGCAAHSVLPLEKPLTGALGLVFLITAHVANWPVVRGGSQMLANALVAHLRSLGGELETGHWVRGPADLPPAKVYLFDTSPDQLASIAEDVLPGGYRKRLGKYRFGPGVFKLDWALDGPVPWKDPRCLEASTVHVGGTLGEIAAAEAAVWRGEHPERPFVLMVQQADMDASRAPEGKRTGYGYCHVPAGSDQDLTQVVERQVERFAPGFRDRILARHVTRTPDLEAHNPNYVGGAVTGGVADMFQLFTRPVARLNPYSTPNPRVFLCSASTPPGGGVHGMCGFFAAESALRRIPKQTARGLLE
ncbi:MAG: NAD(P)/FAD-dependent oxidoreductase [Sandaracinaceae bacterium]|nr:NAD(P)/FAD-dependent oxidoreductase [Sandaracinaceae bacterium]